jgi:hypothetical protein
MKILQKLKAAVKLSLNIPVAMWSYFLKKKLEHKRKHCNHEKGQWLNDHCGVSYYECKKCGEMLIYW